MIARPTYPAFPAKERGAVLFIALVMLLVVTLLAVSSMREVTLEARITGNVIEQKRVMSAAEAALREAERRITNNGAPLDTCSADDQNPCLQSTHPLATEYLTDFGSSKAYRGLGDTTTTLDRSARWYIRDATNVGNMQASCTSSEDILTGQNCTQYYEVNSQAYQGSESSRDCGPDAQCLRSVVSVIYN